jgi:hypothetical protein
MGMAAQPLERRLDRLQIPAGAGHNPAYVRNSILLPQTVGEISTGDDGPLDLG